MNLGGLNNNADTVDVPPDAVGDVLPNVMVVGLFCVFF